VHEFHLRYPGKAIIYSRRGIKFSDWAVFMGGGSLTSLPPIREERFWSDAAKMSCTNMDNPASKQYVLGKAGTGYILFGETKNVTIDLTNDKSNYHLKWINPVTGEATASKEAIRGGRKETLVAPTEGPVVAWLFKTEVLKN
jgi:hypothetical protein